MSLGSLIFASPLSRKLLMYPCFKFNLFETHFFQKHSLPKNTLRRAKTIRGSTKISKFNSEPCSKFVIHFVQQPPPLKEQTKANFIPGNTSSINWSSAFSASIHTYCILYKQTWVQMILCLGRRIQKKFHYTNYSKGFWEVGRNFVKEYS